jgi:battenin
MLLAFFVILPHGPLRRASNAKDYTDIPTHDIDTEDIDDLPITSAASSLLAPGPGVASEAFASHLPATEFSPIRTANGKSRFMANLRRARSLFFPYMLPLLLVYIAEYTINQGVSPTLLYPLGSGVPFSAYRQFYPFYNFLYQIGVFISRSSTPFIRIHNLYLPSFLQIANLAVLISHSLWNWIPSVYLVFVIVFWEGLLGGAVYVNTFAEIMDRVPEGEREFSLGATSVSDSGGICVAGFVGMVLEGALCGWQVRRGRGYCREL